MGLDAYYVNFEDFGEKVRFKKVIDQFLHKEEICYNCVKGNINLGIFLEIKTPIRRAQFLQSVHFQRGRLQSIRNDRGPRPVRG